MRIARILMCLTIYAGSLLLCQNSIPCQGRKSLTTLESRLEQSAGLKRPGLITVSDRVLSQQILTFHCVMRGATSSDFIIIGGVWGVRHGEPRRGGDLDHTLSQLDEKHVRDFLRERPVSYVDELCQELYFSRSLLISSLFCLFFYFICLLQYIIF